MWRKLNIKCIINRKSKDEVLRERKGKKDISSGQ